MKIEYKNSVATKRKIALCYLKLLIKNGNNFTITNIVEQAQINRGTFYLHFKNKEEVWQMIARGMTSKFKSIEEQFRTFDIDRTPEVILNRLNLILKSDLEFYTLVLEAGEQLNLIEKIKSTMLNSIHNNFMVMKYIFSMEHFNIVSQYVVGGVVNTYKEWFNKSINCSLDELSSYLSIIIRQGLKGCIHYGS